MTKLKKKVALILSLVLVFTTIPLNIFASEIINNKIEGSYIEIWTAEDLDNVRNDVTTNYKLMSDIDLSDYISKTNTETKG